MEKKKRGMAEAIQIYNQDGKLIPMEFFDGPNEQKFFPFFENPDGSVPAMVFEEQFEDGKMPENMRFVPGHVRPGEEYTGDLSKVVFDDPLLNLKPSERRILSTEKKMASLKVAVTGVDQDQKGACGIEGTAEPVDFVERRVFSTLEGLFLRTSKDVIPLTNFGLWVVKRRRIVERNCEDRIELALRITCLGEEHVMDLAAVDIDNAVRLIQRKYPECCLLIDTKRGASAVSGYIRECLADCKKETVITSPGFAKVGSQWVYVHDGAVSPEPNTVFRCGKCIGFDRGLSCAHALGQAMELLSLSGRLELILPLFLLVHLGPLFELFREAGCAPRFVTFLAGTTGSLKTSVAMALVHLFEGLNEKPEANFNDTAAALEQKLGSAHSRVLLVDDFAPGINATATRQKLERLEHVVRLVGDQITKSRSTPQLTRAKEFQPCGCCLMTGESTGGSRSSLLRCLVLPIERGDIDGEKLKRYQMSPELLQTHLSHFLTWAGKNGAAVIDFIRQEFLKERAAFTPCVRELRLVDTGALLMLTGRLFLQYAMDVGAVDQGGADNFKQQWREVLEQALRISEQNTHEVDPMTMYLQALFALRHAGKLPLANGASDYKVAEHVGFAVDDQWWLRPDDIYQMVLKFCRANGHSMPLRDRDLHKLLATAGLIEIERGTRDGAERVTYTRRSSVEGRPRMLVVKVTEAKAHLERELGK